MAAKRKKRGSFEEETVGFPSFDGLRIKGTICYPMQAPRGVVLMLVGSGIIDQDEMMPPSLTASGKTERPFAQIAHHLAKQQLITLRYNKRGVLQGRSQTTIVKKIWEGAGRKALIRDATYAAKFLLSKFAMDKGDLMILGHSEGTIIATEVAIALGGSPKALIYLGAVSRSMLEMALFQNIDQRLSEDPSLDRSQLAQEVKSQIRQIMKMKDGIGPDRKPNRWLRESFQAKSNRERLRKTRCPIGIFQGELDLSTPIQEAREIKDTIGKRVRLFSYPGLGHAFSPPRAGQQTLGPISSKVLNDIGKFCCHIVDR